MRFNIDENAFTPLAQAVSGQSRMAGQRAALQNQLLQSQIDAQRQKNYQAMAQDEAKGQLIDAQLRQNLTGYSDDQINAVKQQRFGLPGTPQGFQYDGSGRPVMGDDGVPLAAAPVTFTPEQQTQIGQVVAGLAPRINTALGMNAYGGDGLDYQKALGQTSQNSYNDTLRNAVLNAPDPATRNMAVSTLSGKAYDPYKVDGYGQVYDSGTGAVRQTAASQAKIGNINADTGYTNAGTGLRQAQTQNEYVQTQGNQIRNQGYALDNQNKELDYRNKSVTRAPTNDDVRLFTRMVDDGTGKQVAVTDSELLNKAYAFATQNGYPTVAAALPAFQQAQQQQNTGTLSNLGQAVRQTAGGNAGGAWLVMQDLQSNFGGRINSKNKHQVQSWLQQQVNSGRISKQDAANIWNANSQ